MLPLLLPLLYPQDVIDACFKEMATWVRMLVHTVETEYPRFSMINSMGAFDVSATDQDSDDVKASLQRCAQLYHVDVHGLVPEYEDLWPYAVKFYQAAPSKGCTEAWRRAAEEVQTTASLRRNHPLTNISPVLERVVCYRGCSTSKVERVNACQAPLTEGSRGADKMEALEVAELKIKHDLKEEDIPEVIKLAQASWPSYSHPPRASGSEHRAPHIHKGMRRKGCDTEAC